MYRTFYEVFPTNTVYIGSMVSYDITPVYCFYKKSFDNFFRQLIQLTCFWTYYHNIPLHRFQEQTLIFLTKTYKNDLRFIFYDGVPWSKRKPMGRIRRWLCYARYDWYLLKDLYMKHFHAGGFSWSIYVRISFLPFGSIKKRNLIRVAISNHYKAVNITLSII